MDCCLQVHNPESLASLATALASQTRLLPQRLTALATLHHEVAPAAASAAWHILRDHHRSPFGTIIAFELEGSAYLARIERHYSAPGSEGRPQGFHKGVTLCEPAGR